MTTIATRTSFVLLLALVLAAPSLAGAVDSVTPYGIGTGDPVSSTYSVSVNGVSVPVYSSSDMNYAHFAFTGTANVVVTANQNFSSYQLSPHSFALAPSVSGNEMRFSLNRPRKLLLHEVSGTSAKLCIFADAPEDKPPVQGAANVTTLASIDNSGASDVTTQLQAAIDNMPVGNTLFIPAGRYTFTFLQIRSNKSYYLAPGAILQAPRTQEAQIKLNGCNNVRIYGRGAIDGQGDFQRARTGGGETGTTFISVDQNTSTANVVFEDIIIRNPSLYTCIVFDTVDWRFRNVKFVTSQAYGNRDCIDPHNAQRLIVDDCFFLSTDDNIAYSTLRNDINTDIVVKNCVMSNFNSGACIRLGPWLGDNTHNFTAENCDYVRGAANEGAFAIYAGGAIRDVRFRNMRVENPQTRLIYMISAWNDYYAGWQSGSIDNVHFENLTCMRTTDAWIGFDATDPNSPMSNIRFTNFMFGSTLVTDASQAHVSINGTVSNLTFGTAAFNEVAITAAALSASTAAPTVLTISRSGPTGSSLTIPLIVRGSAVPGSDYTALSGSVVIPAGASSTQVAITPLRSTYPGGRATVVVDLDHSVARSYLLGPNRCSMVTLIDGSPVTQPPAAPTGLSASAGVGQVSLSWSASSGATSYNVWRSTTSGSGYASVATGLTATSYTNSGLTSGVTYYFVVTASGAGGTSGGSNEASATPTSTPPPAGSGSGLTGTYFLGTGLSGSGLSRLDAQVNFSWGTGAPMAGIPADGFSVRWVGQVQAQFSETYTFTTVSDDGVRLWVNGQQLISNWTDHAPTVNSGTIALVAGQKYDLTMEFYENGGGATAQLSWSSASTVAQLIPTAQLFPATAVSATLLNGSFETPAVNGYAYTPSGASWTFASAAAIQANGSAWQAAAAPDGIQTAVLQGAPGYLGSIEQTVAMAAGTYTLRFQAARRYGQAQPVRFSVDGTQIGGLITPASDAFAAYTSANFTVAAGNRTLRLEATDGSDDRSSFIDQVTLVAGGGSDVPSGSGLTGTYFGDTTLTTAVTTRTDATVNFDWAMGSPAPGVAVDNFSVRWSGQVQPQFSETYTFTTTSDDGVRLWVNGQQLVSNWTQHGPTDDSGTITLSAGQKYDIVMEYYDIGWGAVAKLSWSSPSTAAQIIPSSRLYPSAGGGAADSLPAGWTTQDVGAVGLAGSTSVASGTWTVVGGGADIWGTADGMRFVSRTVTGDVQITARVATVGNTNDWAKAGVMIRASAAAGSAHASTFVTPANGVAFQNRLTSNAASGHTAGPAATAPYWVRIERVGDVLIGSSSPDGATWTEIRRQTIALGTTVLVGVAVTSHDNTKLCTATFSNVQVVTAAAAAN